MCGIVGIIDLKLEKVISPESIESMCNVILHRGPNDSGMYIDGPVGLGMRRLSIIDVKEGKQPICNEHEDVWIVFNGEIYNHNDLRLELQKKGHIFKTKSDTETILHLYEETGTNCVRYLRGMFAFAIWDGKRKRLFIARDRLGIKPLFWAKSSDLLIFGSEMKSLLALPFLNHDIDWNGFDSFFTYGYIPAPLTIYKQIYKLPPAHFIVIENGSARLSRYWDLSFYNKFTHKENEIKEEFLSIFHEAVKMRLMSEVPLGAFLSGGIDSGLVVAMMSMENEKRVESFTIKFLGETGDFLDESSYAMEVAQAYNCNHHTLKVTPHVNQALDAGAAAFDEPFADDSVIPTYHICKEAKNYATVILTGLGGDENFAGYERYLGFGLSRYYKCIPPILHRHFFSPLIQNLKEESGGHYRINHLKRFMSGVDLPLSHRFQSYISILNIAQRKSLYTSDIEKQIDFEYVDSLGRIHFERLGEGDWLDRALYQDICMYLPDDILALSDRIGMHHSLELRVPFIDHKLVEFCARIPNSLKIKYGRKKYLLKQAGKALLPKSVLSHRKQGFSAPIAEWLKKDLYAETQASLNNNRVQSDGFFKPEIVQKLMIEHYSRKKLNDKIIFALLVFQKWHERAKQR